MKHESKAPEKESKKTAREKYLEKLNEIAAVYAQMAAESKDKPTRASLNAKIQLPTRLAITEVEKVARQNHPESFFDSFISDEQVADMEDLLERSIKKHKRFVITTVVEGCPVHQGFLASIRSYCEYNDALLILLTCRDPASRIIKDERLIDKALENELFAFREVNINKNISIQPLKTSPKQINPTTGLSRIGQRRGTFIFASSKIVEEIVPVFGPEDLPHALLTTGAITEPRYETDRYMSERTAYIANFDHEFGAVIVEVQNEKVYHFSQIKTDKTGSFCHHSIKYSSNKPPVWVQAEGIVFGDYHSGSTSKAAKKAGFDLARHTKPKKIFVHDSADSRSLNPHESHLQVNLVSKAKIGFLDLSAELDVYTKDMLEIADMAAEWGGEVYIVHSNHDDFISRHIQSENPMSDPYNAREKLLLALAMLDGKNPLEDAFRRRANGKGANVFFLTPDSSIRVGGFECAIHGHVGPKGRKSPGMDELSKAYGPIITGHMHSPGKRKMAYRVGTMSEYRLGYNKGASDWLHTNALISSNDTCQLINSIFGEWRLPPTEKIKNLTKNTKPNRTTNRKAA